MDGLPVTRLSLRGPTFELMVGTARVRGSFKDPKCYFLRTYLGPLGYTGTNDVTLRSDDPQLTSDAAHNLKLFVNWVRKQENTEVTIDDIDQCRIGGDLSHQAPAQDVAAR